MRHERIDIHSDAIGRAMELLAYGHDGLPVLVFPTSEGAAHEYADFGMVEWLTALIEAGRLRLYCVASLDSETWYARDRPLHERGWRHSHYEDWVMNHVVPTIAADVGDPGVRLTTTGCSFGAFHAVNFALKHPARFEHALAMSGVYDIRFLMHGHHDDWVYYNNPAEYVCHMHGGTLDAVRRQTFITLVCGRGAWESKSVESTRAFRHMLDEKGIPNYMDLWGEDVSHEWHWWRTQIVHYMNHIVEGTLPWRPT